MIAARSAPQLCPTKPSRCGSTSGRATSRSTARRSAITDRTTYATSVLASPPIVIGMSGSTETIPCLVARVTASARNASGSIAPPCASTTPGWRPESMAGVTISASIAGPPATAYRIVWIFAPSCVRDPTTSMSSGALGS